MDENNSVEMEMKGREWEIETKLGGVGRRKQQGERLEKFTKVIGDKSSNWSALKSQNLD